MTLKEINFSVDMYGTSAITSSTYETAYTGDEDSVQLKFTVTDEPDLTGATALIHLYFGDSSHVERVCKPITGGFEYTLTGTENDHAGVARTDIYITKGAAKYTRAGYKFRIDRSLEASAPLVEYAVDTVDTVVAETESWLLQAQTDFGTAQDTRAAEWVADNDTRADEFTAAQTSRTNTFNDSEAARTSTFNTNETGRSNTFTTNENARQAAAEAGEVARDASYATAEANRDSQFDANESARSVAETERIAGENARAAAESARVTEYAALASDLTDTLAAADANIENFDVALQTGIIGENIAAELQNLESTYAPRLLSAEQQLEQVDDRIDNIIATPTTVSEQEIIDARDGETALGTKIRNMDSKIIQYLKETTVLEGSVAVTGSSLPAGTTRFNDLYVSKDGVISSVSVFIKTIGDAKLKVLRKEPSNNMWYVIDEITVSFLATGINTLDANSGFVGFSVKQGDALAWFGVTAQLAYISGGTTRYISKEHLISVGEFYTVTGAITLSIAYTLSIPSYVDGKITTLEESPNVIGENAKKYRMVSGSLRTDLTIPEKWRFLEDVGHTVAGISNVYGDVASGDVKLDYNFTAGKVISLTITPHYSAIEAGFAQVGGFVGLSNSGITLRRILNIGAKISFDGVNPIVDSVDAGLTGMAVTTEKPNANTVRVRTEMSSNPVFKANNIPVVSRFSGGYIPEIVAYTDRYVDINFRDDSGALVTALDSNCKFIFSRTAYNKVHAVNDYIPSGLTFWVHGVMEL